MTRRRFDPRVLTIGEGRLSGVAGVVVWVLLVGIFYATVFGFLGSPEGDAQGQPAFSPARWKDWILLLIPVMFLPYLLRALREVARNQRFVLDGIDRKMRLNGREVARFEDVKGLELRPVNLTCEEATLTALLADGRRIDLRTGEAWSAMDALADRAAEVLGVEVVKSG